MPNFAENRALLLHAFDGEIINEEEFLLLYDVNKSSNLDLPYWNYEKFDLDSISDDECRAEFRFLRNDIYTLYEVLAFPEEIVCSNGFRVPGVTAFCALLKRFSYPCRYLDMIPLFGVICSSNEYDL